MNRKYIDFVPANKTEVEVPKEKTTVKVSKKTVTQGAYRALPQSSEAVRMARPAKVRAESVTRVRTETVSMVRTKPRVQTLARPKSSDSFEAGFSLNNEPALGVIEDLNTKFVSNEVEKRPLGGNNPLLRQNDTKDAKAIKSKKLIGRKAKKQAVNKPVEKSVEKSVEKVGAKAGASSDKTFKMPKTPFINQEKVVKRPLSRNVYPEKVSEPKEEKGPVTIISKPEKDGVAGKVIAIIIIIILGATAGTVAFLLLPK